MRSITRLALWTGSTFALAGTALAADMTGAEIKAFAWGKTVYLDSAAAGVSGQTGQSVIYWTEDGTALNKTPNGSIMHGKRARSSGSWHRRQCGAFQPIESR